MKRYFTLKVYSSCTLQFAFFPRASPWNCSLYHPPISTRWVQVCNSHKLLCGGCRSQTRFVVTACLLRCALIVRVALQHLPHRFNDFPFCNGNLISTTFIILDMSSPM